MQGLSLNDNKKEHGKKPDLHLDLDQHNTSQERNRSRQMPTPPPITAPGNGQQQDQQQQQQQRRPSEKEIPLSRQESRPRTDSNSSQPPLTPSSATTPKSPQAQWSVNMMPADVKDRMLNFQKSRQRTPVPGPGTGGSGNGGSNTSSNGNSLVNGNVPGSGSGAGGLTSGQISPYDLSSRHSSQSSSSAGSPLMASPPLGGGSGNGSGNGKGVNISAAQALAAAAQLVRQNGSASPDLRKETANNIDELVSEKTPAEHTTSETNHSNAIESPDQSKTPTVKSSDPSRDSTPTPHGALYSNTPPLQGQGKPSLSQRRGINLSGGASPLGGVSPRSDPLPQSAPLSTSLADRRKPGGGPGAVGAGAAGAAIGVGAPGAPAPAPTLANLRAGANASVSPTSATPGAPGAPGAAPGGRSRPSLRGAMPGSSGGHKGGSVSENGLGSGGNLFNSYVQYIDIKTGSLNFAGKASVHANGIEFSSGSSFRISLDELENMGELGRGNYGTVTKVLHKPTNVIMAMKEIRLELEETKFRQIIMELDILHKCVSPFIVDFYGAFFVEGAVYVCMEYMDGGSLNKIYQGGMPEQALAKIADAVVRGLLQLKEEHNIIHRDVKPTNILVSTNGKVKLCDFGVSGNLVASIARTNVGCQSYMAPERIRSKNPNEAITYTVESDVWSLGLSLVEIASGEYPYPAETYGNIFSQLSAIVDGAPPQLPDTDKLKFSKEAQDFVATCLHKNPKQRPSYSALLEHPWLVKYRDIDVDMGAIVKEALSRQPNMSS